MLAAYAPKKFYLDTPTLPNLLTLVLTHDKNKFQYQNLDDYYRGKHDVLNRKMEEGKPNNKAVNNFPKLIVDTSTSYFLGEEVTYDVRDKTFSEKLFEVLENNNANDVTTELGKISSIHGHAFEVHWINKEGNHKFKQVSPKNCLMVYSTDLEEEPVAAIIYNSFRDALLNSEVKKVSIFTKDTIYELKHYGETGEYEMLSSEPHYFGEVPVVEYVSNEERQGDFESVITLIDAYNVTVSDSINDVEYWNDAYLMLTNLNSTTEEDIHQMKQNRVLLVDGDGDAKFITKNVNDKHVENIKDRLTQDIHKFSQTPNLHDEQFATNLSGVAIKYKMLGMETKTAIKERKFHTSLQRRIRLIATILNLKGNSFDYKDVRITFTRNLPANLIELADMAVKLREIVSDETLREQFPFIHDLELEEERLEKQQEKANEQAASNILNADFSQVFKKEENPEETPPQEEPPKGDE